MKVGEGRTVCFLAVPTDRAIRSLRRYVFASDGGTCTVNPHGYHDASIVVGERPCPQDLIDRGLIGSGLLERGPDDPPFPDACVCGYEFRPADQRQVNTDRLFARADDPSQRWLHRDLPPGAMWDNLWHRTFGVGPDGLSWTVRLPCGHDWDIDGPATNGGRWSRKGTAPALSVSPSILCSNGHYHGWLGVNGNPPGVLSAHIG